MRLNIFFALSALLYSVTPAFAVTVPSFPACAAPQGTIIASYSQGTHGIVGSSDTYVGSDTVYRVNDEAITQCFCPSNGNGIQTDWLKATNLTETDIKVLESQGWFYIPNGSAWGIDESPYVARNSTFSCLPGSSPVAVSSNSTGTGGADQRGSQAGSVLGLAATGNTLALIGVFATSATFLILGISRLLRSESDEKVS